MDAVTEAVQEQYQRFAYPSGPPLVRQGTDARVLLSLVQRGRPQGRPLQVLDAGCGRGVGLVGCAIMQPDVLFTGIDLCGESLDDAGAEIERRELGNVTLQQIDLMTLDELVVPPDGFDVILSSGVVHHLSDPLHGLQQLRAVLAPHGVLSLMLYGTHGRATLYRLVRAIDALVPRGRPLDERLAVGRELVRQSEFEALQASPLGRPGDISDAEFVDRYLNVNETSYDIDGLIGLVDASGLGFLRWMEPADWNLRRLLPPGKTLELGLARSPIEQWKIVDELFWRPRLELLLCHSTNGPRAPISDAELERELLCVSPDVGFGIETRYTRGATRTEKVTVQVRAGETVQVVPGATARAVTLVAESPAPFLGADLIQALEREGYDAGVSRSALLTLIECEVLYRPHATEI